MKPVEKSQPHYYSKNHPLSSYTYQESVTKFNFTDNPNVIKFNIAKIGIVKLRGCKGYFDNYDLEMKANTLSKKLWRIIYL